MSRRVLESALQRRIIAYLRAQGCYVFKVVGSPLQQRGTPDLLVCWQGRFLAIEIKAVRPDTGRAEKPTPLQLHEMAKVTAAGGRAVVVESLEQVIELLAASPAVAAPEMPCCQDTLYTQPGKSPRTS